MFHGNRAKNWILSLNPKNFQLAFKVAVGTTSLLCWFFFGYAVGLLLLLSCIVAFRLPVLIVYFNELHLGEVSKTTTSTAKVTNKTKTLQQSSQPYFLIEYGQIPCEVDEALEKFLNGALEKFVISWQTSFEIEEGEFIQEIRHIIKYIIINLYQLVEKVDWADVIITKFIPRFLWHLDCYNSGAQSVESKEIEKNVLIHFGNHLHPAVSDRKTEESFLRHCSQKMLEVLLPPELKSSKILTLLLRDILSCQILQTAMDAIAEPNNINKLFVILFDESVDTTVNIETSNETVPILYNFTKVHSFDPSDKLMYPSLSGILKTPPHLYQLIQFLKRENALKYLQFCFAVDEFNEKLLNPDLKLEQMERLHVMGQKMYEIFFRRTSPDCIGFEKESKLQMKAIVYGKAEEIVHLRTSPTLFEAYEYVMNTLEQRILPRFYRSPEFYELVTGAQQSAGKLKLKQTKSETITAGWGQKLRAALRPSWLATESKSTGSLANDADENCDMGIDLTEADFIAEDSDVDEGAGAYAGVIPCARRDLTAWKASIPKVISAMDSAGKPIWAFEVEIQRIDLRPEDDPEEYHWTVVRTYAEFYNLESKLTEFHGEFVDIRLPAKKMFGTRGFEFLQTVRPEFESFLRTLLQQPALKGSDLIFSFLTLSDLSACQTSGDSSFMSGNLLPDLGLSRIMKHVPLKLRKERGQDLESFLQTFIASTESPKAKSNKSDARDMSADEVSVPIYKELHPIYKDNAKSFLASKSRRPGRTSVQPPLMGAYDSLLYAAWKIWQVPKIIWNLLVALRSLVSVYFDSFAKKYVNGKLKVGLQPHKVTQAIKLLHELVLEEPPANVKSKTQNRRDAWNSLVKTVPEWVTQITGSQAIEDRCKIFFQCLQFPVLNKQLSYALFDILLIELFPEIILQDEPS